MNRFDFNTNKRSRLDPFVVGDRVMYLDSSHGTWMKGTVNRISNQSIYVHFDHYKDDPKREFQMFGAELVHE